MADGQRRLSLSGIVGSGVLAGGLGALASLGGAAVSSARRSSSGPEDALGADDDGLGDDADGGQVRGPRPEFLPMVPWYSGTSADLLKTALDLAITLKLFVGRFDMRTMQVCTDGGRSLWFASHQVQS
jgi:hypothetical protein